MEEKNISRRSFLKRPGSLFYRDILHIGKKTV